MRYYFRRKNPDEIKRNLERAAKQGGSDEMLRFLVSKLRSGEIRREHVELAAQLGHPWAQK